jgi:hypothetical protein
MSFSVNISKFAANCNATLGEACRAIKLELFSSVILDTRVDTGRMRGNWQTSTGSPILNETEREDKEGVETINEAEQNITNFEVDYMTNNVPYAIVWEERDAMIAKNMLRIERNLRRFK